LPLSLPYEFGIAGLLGIVVLFWIAGRIKSHIAVETVRLPNGRLDR
jgi:hypothetical protein